MQKLSLDKLYETIDYINFNDTIKWKSKKGRILVFKINKICVFLNEYFNKMTLTIVNENLKNLKIKTENFKKFKFVKNKIKWIKIKKNHDLLTATFRYLLGLVDTISKEIIKIKSFYSLNSLKSDESVVVVTECVETSIFFRSVFSKMGFDVIFVNSNKSIVPLSRKKRIVLFILNSNLPDFNQSRCLLDKINLFCPIFVIVNSENYNIFLDGKIKFFDDVIVKPYNEAQIYTALKKHGIVYI